MSDIDDALEQVELGAAERQEITRSEGIRRRNRILSAQHAADQALLEDQAKRLAVYETLDSITLDVPAFTPRPAEGEHHATVCAVLTDTHYGEVVDPREIHGVNAYNPKIAEKRTERFFQAVVSLAKDYHRGITYDGACLFLGGDMLSGDIHDELTETNAETTQESILHFLDPVERGIKLLADEFGRVDVPCVVGNHPRRTRKPRAKRRAITTGTGRSTGTSSATLAPMSAYTCTWRTGRTSTRRSTRRSTA